MLCHAGEHDEELKKHAAGEENDRDGGENRSGCHCDGGVSGSLNWELEGSRCS